MKVLFVSSGNSENCVKPIVNIQGNSLEKLGINVDYFTIVGKGLKGYLKNVSPLKSHIKKNDYNIIHAHYALSALVATLAGAKPLIVSLMGSDIRLSLIFRLAINFSWAFFWDALIVKSQDMMDNIGIRDCKIIPNGVDLSLFMPTEKKAAIEKLCWNGNRKHILFAANPDIEVKNFKLLEKAWGLLDSSKQTELHTLVNLPHQEIPLHMSAADVVILTSLWEGSPNVIKEAMACNRPIVATDMGDIEWLFGQEPGCFLTSFDPKDVANKLKLALDFSQKYGRTQGRNRMIELGLDSATIAKKIIKIYESVQANG